MTENNNTSKTSDRTLKIVAIILAVIVALGGGALYWQSYVGPQRHAQSILDDLTNRTGKIAAVNTDMVTFAGQKVENTNTDQKALARSEERRVGKECPV